MIWIKIHNIENCLYLTFSSVYKLTQFFEIHNYLKSPEYLQSQQLPSQLLPPTLKKNNSSQPPGQVP